jgi:hypothetical protein
VIPLLQTSDVAVDGSFRDPSGFVFVREGTLFRQVNDVYRPHYDMFVQSGLYSELASAGLLVPHEEADTPGANGAAAYKVLRPERISFISYPYEWCFGQLKSAALLTLRIETIARRFGMSLKDASAYNVQFCGSRPVFIDTLSFQPYRPTEPWIAYRQFCQFFVAPLALMRFADVRLNQLLRVFIDGVPLDVASGMLPWRTRFNTKLGVHLHLHAAAQKRALSAAQEPSRRGKSRMSSNAQNGLLESLESTIRELEWEPRGTLWADYYDKTNYTDQSLLEKSRIVDALIGRAQPTSAWDLGANTGKFSRLASAREIRTIAFDVDPAAVERSYREAVQAGERNLLPLVLDLNNPSSAIGWASEERMSLEERGPADLLLVLALVHHLAIGNNVPLPRIASWLASLGRQLVIEFVPKSDSQVQRLLAAREDVFPNYTQRMFEQAFAQDFDTVDVTPIAGTERTIYFMRRKRA